MKVSGDKKIAAVSAAAESLALGLPPLSIRAERLAATVALGEHGRRRSGTGQDFWQFHRYRAGEDAARIDWRQSARSNHLYAREQEGEAAQSVWIWCDGSASMHFSSARQEEKIVRADLLALALTHLLLRGGERVALYGDGTPPGGDKRTFWHMAHRLSAGLSGGTPGAALPPDMALPRHGEFVWISDFLSPMAGIERTMHRLVQQGVKGRFVHIVDPAEEDFPFSGRVRFEAAAGGETQIFGRAERAREEYRRRFAARAAALADLARHYGWHYLRHRTDLSARVALLALYTGFSASGAV